MEWEAWCEAYPVREVDTVDQASIPYDQGPFDDRKDAESRKEWLEMTYECGGFEIVICKGQFWILS